MTEGASHSCSTHGKCKTLSVLFGSVFSQVRTRACWPPYTYLCIWCLGPRDDLYHHQLSHHNWRPLLRGSHQANRATTTVWEKLSHVESPNIAKRIVKITTPRPNVGKPNRSAGVYRTSPPQGHENAKTSLPALTHPHGQSSAYM